MNCLAKGAKIKKMETKNKYYNNVHIARLDTTFELTTKISNISFKDWIANNTPPTYITCVSPKDKDPFKKHKCLGKIFLDRWYVNKRKTNIFEENIYNNFTLQRLIGNKDQIVATIDDNPKKDIIIIDNQDLENILKNSTLKNNLDAISIDDQEQVLMTKLYEDGWALFDKREYINEIASLQAKKLIDSQYVCLTKSSRIYDIFLRLTKDGEAIRKYLAETKYIPDQKEKEIVDHLAELKETIAGLGNDNRILELKRTIESYPKTDVKKILATGA